MPIKTRIYKKLINSYLKINANIKALEYSDKYLFSCVNPDKDIIEYK